MEQHCSALIVERTEKDCNYCLARSLSVHRNAWIKLRKSIEDNGSFSNTLKISLISNMEGILEECEKGENTSIGG